MMMKDRTNAEQICTSQARGAKMKGESGDSSALKLSNTASEHLWDEKKREHPHGADESLCASTTSAYKGGAEMARDKETGFETAPTLGKALGMALEESPRKTLQVDTAKYQEYLDDPDLSNEQKEQIVEALWTIIIAFVDLGYGVSPLQEACGKLSEINDESGETDDDLLRVDADTLTQTFSNHAAE